MAFIEGAPLHRIGLKATAVGREIAKSEFADSAVQALADLAAHFAESTPPEIALGECPLEKGDAISIVRSKYRGRSVLLGDASARLFSITAKAWSPRQQRPAGGGHCPI